MKKHKGGRPVEITEDHGKEIDEIFLQGLCDGLSLRKIAEQDDVPVSVRWFTKRVALDDDLKERFILSKAAGLWILQDSIEDGYDATDEDLRKMKTARTEDGQEVDVPFYDPKQLNAMVNNTKNRMHDRKWALSKMLPKDFGDKIMVADGDGKQIPTVNFVLSQGASVDGDSAEG
jgi:hypothetical protein